MLFKMLIFRFNMSTRAVESWHRMLSRIHTNNLDMLRIVGYTDSADGERKLIAAIPVSLTIQKIKHEGAVESIRVATFFTLARFDDHTVEKNDTVKFYDAHPDLRMCSCEYSDEIDREYQVAVKEANDLYGDGKPGCLMNSYVLMFYVAQMAGCFANVQGTGPVNRVTAAIHTEKSGFTLVLTI